MSTPAVHFSGPKKIPYPGGCVLEPAPYALEYLLKWPADVTVNGQIYHNKQVFPFLRDLLADPQQYGLTLQQAEQARDLYLELAGQALEQEGGQREWLAREFAK